MGNALPLTAMRKQADAGAGVDEVLLPCRLLLVQFGDGVDVLAGIAGQALGCGQGDTGRRVGA